MFVKSKESDFMEKHFKDYYKKHFVDSVPSVENREFGYGVFGRKIANRNMAFANAKEMNSFLRETNPLFFSYSNAYYNFPSRKPMPRKELVKADIIYEFDADDFGEVEEIGGYEWFSKENIEATKKQVFRLVDVLEKDFAFGAEGMSINFSGKAGYHVHIRNEEIQALGKRARIELVDYLTGSGADFANLGYDFKGLKCAKGKGLWVKRINEGIKSFFEKDMKEIAIITEMQKSKLKQFTSEAITKAVDGGYLLSVGPRKSKEFWQKVLEYVVSEQKIPIDRQTSIDMNKIIRVPETLHGSTGLLAKKVSIDELKTFEPYNEGVVFGEERARIFIKKAPKFSLNGQEFGPFEEQEEELPLYVVIYLLGKGAKLV